MMNTNTDSGKYGGALKELKCHLKFVSIGLSALVAGCLIINTVFEILPIGLTIGLALGYFIAGFFLLCGGLLSFIGLITFIGLLPGLKMIVSSEWHEVALWVFIMGLSFGSGTRWSALRIVHLRMRIK
ncbi:hypothetical protein A3715_11430 [Oleiphilus sp. HI0009]|nr:hypothetical protein A3715_11430 [Oleiphilus sp. HI0009]